MSQHCHNVIRRGQGTPCGLAVHMPPGVDHSMRPWLDAAEGFGGAPALGALMAGLRRAAAAPGAHATSGL
jgi:hypothetical protein